MTDISDYISNYVESFLSDTFISDLKFNKFELEGNEFNEKSELDKLIKLRSAIFLYKEDLTLRYFINNGFLCFSNEIVDYLHDLINVDTLSNELRQVISELIFSYQSSILSLEYKKNIDKKNFEYFYAKFNIKEFFNLGVFHSQAINFYVMCIEYLETNEVFITNEVILLLFKRLSFNELALNRLIDLLVKRERCLDLIYPFINNKKKYETNLSNFILENHSLGFVDDTAHDLFILMLKDNQVNYELFVNVTNNIVNEINSMAIDFFDSQGNYVSIIHSIETFLKRINSVLNTNKTNFQVCIDKLLECRRSLLYFKRLILQNDKAVTKSLKQFEFEFKVDKKIEETFEQLEKDINQLYNVLRIDFKEAVKSSIKLYSDFPLQYNITRYTLNTDLQTYSQSNNDTNNKLSEFYCDFGNEFIINNRDKLLNIPNMNIYTLLLDYENSYYPSTINFVANVISKKFKNIIKVISERYNLSGNYFVDVLKNILICESYLFGIHSTFQVKYETNISEVLINLFVDEKDEYLKNGLIYVYYQFYEKNGPQLRNMYAHGDALSINDHLANLLITISCIQFLGYYSVNYGKK